MALYCSPGGDDKRGGCSLSSKSSSWSKSSAEECCPGDGSSGKLRGFFNSPCDDDDGQASARWAMLPSRSWTKSWTRRRREVPLSLASSHDANRVAASTLTGQINDTDYQLRLPVKLKA